MTVFGATRNSDVGRVPRIDRDGSDETGNGTESAPWRTIGFALDQAALLAQDSTRIVVQTGTYVEDLLLEEGVSITGATATWSYRAASPVPREAHCAISRSFLRKAPRTCSK